MTRTVPTRLIVAICEAAGVDPSDVTEMRITPTTVEFVTRRTVLTDVLDD